MKLFNAPLGLLVASLCAGPWANLPAATIFSDNFDDGDVSDWTKTTNYGGTNAVTVRTDSFVSPSYSMWTYLEAPPGGVDLIVRASHDFTTSEAVDHTLSLWARSSPCSGCTISYDILVDGVSLARTFAPIAFEFRSFLLSGLTPGLHSLALGIHTTNASSGNFSASFDDVLITSSDVVDPGPGTGEIPEPATMALIGGGLAALAMLRHNRR